MDVIKRNRKAKSRKQQTKLGSVQKKILLLLLGGFALGSVRSPKQQWKIAKGIIESWKDITRQAAERAIESLYESRLLEARENPDGTHTLTLSENGKKRALTYHLLYMKIKPSAVWDKKWRIILYDIPEDEREARNAFREHLKRLGFRKLQQSAGVTPFECRDEIEFVIELLDIRKYVRYIVGDYIDNEAYWKHVFKLDHRI